MAFPAIVGNGLSRHATCSTLLGRERRAILPGAGFSVSSEFRRRKRKRSSALSSGRLHGGACGGDRAQSTASLNRSAFRGPSGSELCPFCLRTGPTNYK